jgi:hypothetical protein
VFPIAVESWYPSGWTQLGFHNRGYPVFFVRQSTLMHLKRELRQNMHAMKAIAIIVVLLLAVVSALGIAAGSERIPNVSIGWGGGVGRG